MVGRSPGVAISMGLLRPLACSRFPSRETAGADLEQSLTGTVALALLGRMYLPVLFSRGRVAHGVLQLGGLAGNRLVARRGFGSVRADRRASFTCNVSCNSEGSCRAGDH